MSPSIKSKGLAGSWKPGNPTPDTSSLQLPNIHDETSSDQQPLTPSSKAKKLSGSTMNMRFMQRRRESDDAAAASRKRKAQEEKYEQEEQEQEQQNPNSECVCVVNNDESSTTQRNRNVTMLTATVTSSETAAVTEITAKQQTTSSPLVIMANGWDMYGSDVIGRRSFGGFNKVVGETWSAANHQKQKGIGSNNSTITDEQLLSRYKTYVTGDDRRKSSNGSSTCRPIGNLDTASKRKKSM